MNSQTRDAPAFGALRIAVVSDTHVPRFAFRLPEALALVAAEHPDAVVHCGDFTSLEVVAPFERIAPFFAVAGNNDGPEIVSRFGRRRVLELGGRRLGIVHGDGTRGTTLERARAAFAGETLDAIVFGHSHVPYLERHDGIVVLNPGSVTDRRRQPAFSFGILEMDSSGVRPRLVYFGG